MRRVCLCCLHPHAHVHTCIRIVRSDELFTEKAARRRVPMVLPLVKWLRAVTRLFWLHASIGVMEREASASHERLEAARRHARAVLESRQRRLSRLQALGNGDGRPAGADVDEVCCCVANRGCARTVRVLTRSRAPIVATAYRVTRRSSHLP